MWDSLPPVSQTRIGVQSPAVTTANSRGVFHGDSARNTSTNSYSNNNNTNANNPTSTPTTTTTTAAPYTNSTTSYANSASNTINSLGTSPQTGALASPSALMSNSSSSSSPSPFAATVGGVEASFLQQQQQQQQQPPPPPPPLLQPPQPQRVPSIPTTSFPSSPSRSPTPQYPLPFPSQPAQGLTLAVPVAVRPAATAPPAASAQSSTSLYTATGSAATMSPSAAAAAAAARPGTAPPTTPASAASTEGSQSRTTGTSTTITANTSSNGSGATPNLSTSGNAPMSRFHVTNTFRNVTYAACRDGSGGGGGESSASSCGSNSGNLPRNPIQLASATPTAAATATAAAAAAAGPHSHASSSLSPSAVPPLNPFAYQDGSRSTPVATPHPHHHHQSIAPIINAQSPTSTSTTTTNIDCSFFSPTVIQQAACTNGTPASPEEVANRSFESTSSAASAGFGFERVSAFNPFSSSLLRPPRSPTTSADAAAAPAMPAAAAGAENLHHVPVTNGGTQGDHHPVREAPQQPWQSSKAPPLSRSESLEGNPSMWYPPPLNLSMASAPSFAGSPAGGAGGMYVHPLQGFYPPYPNQPQEGSGGGGTGMQRPFPATPPPPPAAGASRGLDAHGRPLSSSGAAAAAASLNPYASVNNASMRGTFNHTSPSSFYDGTTGTANLARSFFFNPNTAPRSPGGSMASIPPARAMQGGSLLSHRSSSPGLPDMFNASASSGSGRTTTTGFRSPTAYQEASEGMLPPNLYISSTTTNASNHSNHTAAVAAATVAAEGGGITPRQLQQLQSQPQQLPQRAGPGGLSPTAAAAALLGSSGSSTASKDAANDAVRAALLPLQHLLEMYRARVESYRAYKNSSAEQYLNDIEHSVDDFLYKYFGDCSESAMAAGARQSAQLRANGAAAAGRAGTVLNTTVSQLKTNLSAKLMSLRQGLFSYNSSNNNSSSSTNAAAGPAQRMDPQKLMQAGTSLSSAGSSAASPVGEGSSCATPPYVDGRQSPLLRASQNPPTVLGVPNTSLPNSSMPNRPSTAPPSPFVAASGALLPVPSLLQEDGNNSSSSSSTPSAKTPNRGQESSGSQFASPLPPPGIPSSSSTTPTTRRETCTETVPHVYEPQALPLDYFNTRPSARDLAHMQENHKILVYVMRHMLPPETLDYMADIDSTASATPQESPAAAAETKKRYNVEDHLLIIRQLVRPHVEQKWRDNLNPLKIKLEELIQIGTEQLPPAFNKVLKQISLAAVGGAGAATGAGLPPEKELQLPAALQLADEEAEGDAALASYGRRNERLGRQLRHYHTLLAEKDRVVASLQGDLEYINTIDAMDAFFLEEERRFEAYLRACAICRDARAARRSTMAGQQQQQQQQQPEGEAAPAPVAPEPWRSSQNLRNTSAGLSQYVPVTGLLLSRLHRLEVDHRNALELWGAPARRQQQRG